MTRARVELRPTIDRAWLEERSRAEPFVHAFALWDLDRTPEAIRFTSALREERTEGYLLIWHGRPPRVVVHWYGAGPAAEALVEALPPRPFIAVVPPEVRAAVEAARGAGRAFPIDILARSRNAPLPDSSGVRRLGAHDRRELWEWAQRQHDPAAVGYPELDPDREPVWAGFEGGEIVAAAHAQVQLPGMWLLGGVYVTPEARARGWGAKVTAAAVREGEANGATVGLYVRQDRTPAVRLYARLGFHPIAHRVWLDLGAGLEP